LRITVEMEVSSDPVGNKRWGKVWDSCLAYSVRLKTKK